MALQGVLPNPAPYQYVSTYIVCAINVLNIVRGPAATFFFYLGPQREYFQGSMTVMSNNSTWCRDLFAGNPQTNTFEQPNITRDTFQQLYNWMSDGNPSNIARDVTFQGLTSTAAGFQKMIKICIAAWRLRCNAMEDLLVGLLGIGYFRGGLLPNAGDIDLVFKEMQGSMLCRYMCVSFNVRMMDWRNQPPQFLDLLKVARQHLEIQTEFFHMITDTALKYGEVRMPPDLKNYPICLFHTHSDKTRCWADEHTFGSHPWL
jgi:hypothetical protein